MTRNIASPARRALFALGLLALGASTSAQAVVYDFKQTGGPGGNASTGSHLFVEVTENLTTQANDVLFKFTNEIPILNPAQSPSVSYLYFDTGTYTSLITGVSVTETYGDNVNLIVRTAATHSFLPTNFTPEYKIGLSNIYPYDRPIYGINPGEYAVLSSTLGDGYTFADVIAALDVGLNSNLATAATGLRIGELNYFLDGTGGDDGGFVTNSVVAVPEAETWTMLLAGLGLLGFMMRRRKA